MNKKFYTTLKTTLSESFPLIITNFINELGAVTFRYLPVLLVERSINSISSSAILSMGEIAAIGGIYLGGKLVDRMGSRSVTLVAFAISGLATGFLYFAQGAVFLAITVFLARGSKTLLQSSNRFLLLGSIREGDVITALNILKSTNRLGKVLGQVAAVFLIKFQTRFVFALDSITSFLALYLGSRFIPKEIDETHPEGQEKKRKFHSNEASTHSRLYISAIINGIFAFLLYLFLLAVPARLFIEYGKPGIVFYSQVMLANAIALIIFRLPSTRLLDDPKISIPIGMTLVSFAILITLGFKTISYPLLCAGIFALTVGELIYVSTGSYILMISVPKTDTPGELYSRALLIRMCIRAVAGLIAFPFVVHGNYVVLVVFVAAFIGLSLSYYLLPYYRSIKALNLIK